ncbi:hypothetical protein PUN28_013676 [Cardiocondyla obscurior]|uniref:Transposase n=1 Tax=Cardiocondyla obscurior TaxID=286306 RepID=A0AAW2F8D4_9HYME
MDVVSQIKQVFFFLSLAKSNKYSARPLLRKFRVEHIFAYLLFFAKDFTREAENTRTLGVLNPIYAAFHHDVRRRKRMYPSVDLNNKCGRVLSDASSAYTCTRYIVANNCGFSCPLRLSAPAASAPPASRPLYIGRALSVPSRRAGAHVNKGHPESTPTHLPVRNRATRRQQNSSTTLRNSYLSEDRDRNVSRIRERVIQAPAQGSSEYEECRELVARGRNSRVKKSRQPSGKLLDLSDPGP